MRAMLMAILLLGCGAGPSAAREEPPSRYGYLVLRAGADGAHVQTDWLDADGTLHGRADGAYLGIADRLYRFESRTERVTLRPCDLDSGGGESAPLATVASAMLVGVGGHASLQLIGPTDDDALTELAHHLEEHRVLAALDTRIVVESRRERSACGVHADLVVTVRTFEFGTGAEVFPDEDELAATETLAGLRALDPNRTEAIPSAVLTYVDTNDAIGITWLEVERASMGDGFALTGE